MLDIDLFDIIGVAPSLNNEVGKLWDWVIHLESMCIAMCRHDEEIHSDILPQYWHPMWGNHQSQTGFVEQHTAWALQLQEDQSANNKEINELPTSLPLSRIYCLIAVNRYLCGIRVKTRIYMIWFIYHYHSLADELVWLNWVTWYLFVTMASVAIRKI